MNFEGIDYIDRTITTNMLSLAVTPESPRLPLRLVTLGCAFLGDMQAYHRTHDSSPFGLPGKSFPYQIPHTYAG